LLISLAIPIRAYLHFAASTRWTRDKRDAAGKIVLGTHVCRVHHDVGDLCSCGATPGRTQQNFVMLEKSIYNLQSLNRQLVSEIELRILPGRPGHPSRLPQTGF